MARRDSGNDVVRPLPVLPQVLGHNVASHGEAHADDLCARVPLDQVLYHAVVVGGVAVGKHARRSERHALEGPDMIQHGDAVPVDLGEVDNTADVDGLARVADPGGDRQGVVI